MRMRFVLSLALVLAVTLIGCARDDTLAPETAPVAAPVADSHLVTPEDVALELSRIAGWEIDEEAATGLDDGRLARGNPFLSGFERQDLGNGIAHYFVEVRFGDGPFDLIGLHRVVKERRPGVVGRKLANLFLLHGDAKDFMGMFLPGVVGPNTPDDWGLAIHLAEAGVDVWGMDQGWCFVNESNVQQSEAVGWGQQRSADDLRLGVAAARLVRLVTGNGGAPMNVLGYSSGVQTIYAAASDEAVLPRWQRNIGGLVPADFYLKTDVPSFQQFFCDDVAFQQSLIDDGQIFQRIPFDLLVQFYQADPDGDSVIFPGFTNEQVYWYFTTGALFGEETFHYFGGIYGDGPFAEAFRFVDQAWVNDFLAAGIQYQPTQFILDYDRTVCDQEDVPWDDNLHLIDVPILNLAARGGVDDLGLYTTSLTASTDVSSVVVATLPMEDILVDFGHIDLFLAPMAEEAAWNPLLDWVLEHTPKGGHGRQLVREGR